MKVLIVGGGGREHTLAWKIAQSPLVKAIYCAPGNAGTTALGTNVDVGGEDVDALFTFARETGIDLTVVGPEAPLCAGIVDRFHAGGLKIFGPKKAGARLEGSKVFAKELMREHNIPTAKFQVFDEAENARKYVADLKDFPVVVKADGLAAGKGVTVCRDREEAETAIRESMEARRFGSAGDRLIIEDCLEGEETSILAVTDGKTIVTLPPSQDHKAVFDGDQGPNTGGMGAYAPAPVVTGDLLESIERMVLVPTVHAIGKESESFRGVLYAGLMLTKSGPKVLEYNVRFGDPETQPLLTLLKSDIVELILASVEGRLDQTTLEVHPGYSVCVVMASGGYPGSYAKGKEITGLEAADALEGTTVFHAGTTAHGGKVFTSGGRVLGVTARAETLAAARDRAYEAAGKIEFEGAHFRKDIAAKGIARLGS
ncbi:MAG: phosphoribosylamine--glycine ligase [Planctomycetota bacterium]|jgi:phosphoribosylamine--glycine ligase